MTCHECWWYGRSALLRRLIPQTLKRIFGSKRPCYCPWVQVWMSPDTLKCPGTYAVDWVETERCGERRYQVLDGFETVEHHNEIMGRCDRQMKLRR